MKIDRISVCENSQLISHILTESWETPHLDYSRAYIDWEFSFPGQIGSLGVMAYDESGTGIGFMGAVARRLTFRHRPFDIYLSSFHAVLPHGRGSGVGTAVCRLLATSLKENKVPVFSFAKTGSAAERNLVGVYRDAGYQVCPLRTCRTYGYAFRRQQRPKLSIRIEVTDSYAAFVNAIDDCRGAGAATNCPTIEQFEHYKADPRGRLVVLARSSHGDVIGAAMIIKSVVITKKGIETIPAIDCVFLPESAPDSLVAMCDFAAISSGLKGDFILVSVPNVTLLSPETIQRAMLRATATSFSSYLFLPTGDSLIADVMATNLEVV